MNDAQDGTQAPEAAKWREIATEAIRFWERMRLVYCGVLSAVVLYYFARDWPGSLERLDLEFLMMLFLLVVLANVLYSLAYLPDLFVQVSAFRQAWMRARWGLFLVGTAVAAILTRFIAMELFVRHRG
jgi:hypothetical protein